MKHHSLPLLIKGLLTAILINLAGTAHAAVGPQDIVPRPVSYRLSQGTCAIDAPVKVQCAGRALRSRTAALPDFAKEEAYELTVTPRYIRIRALTPTGEFRARQTLAQLQALARMDEENVLPCCQIFDWPRFRHRGLMIDESRSFKGKAFLFKQMDAMALLKLNVLHLHLTDAAGWRLQIHAFPNLTDSVAWRIGQSYFTWEKGGYPFTSQDNPEAYGGFYTHEDIREIVRYAAQRHIAVIPEIEMPGHSLEVNRAYPERSCQSADGKLHPFSWDLCPGREETLRFLESVLDEVFGLFPSQLVHIGGDEAVMNDWKDCIHCQGKMRQEGMQDVHELQGYLIRHIDAYARSRGRRIIGWDEILETGIPTDAAVQSWRGVKGGKKAIAAGHDVVMSPNTHCYFDYYQDLICKEPPACGPLVSLRHVYTFNPVVNGIETQQASHILGLQANLWCEYIPTCEHAEYMLYPRTFAIAEIGWTPQEERDYAHFRPRAERLRRLWNHLGYRTFDLDTESPRAKSVCFESSRSGHNFVLQEGGPILSYKPGDGVRIIVDGENGFRDMNGNGTLEPFEDWRLDPGVRASDLAARLKTESICGLDLPDTPAPERLTLLFTSGDADNPFHAVNPY